MPDSGIVTEIRLYRRGSKRRLVMVDNDLWREMASDVVQELRLRSGESIDVEAVSTEAAAIEPRLARERALRLLNYRERTAAETRDRLIDDGYPAGVAAAVVADLVDCRLIDDARFAEASARSLVQNRSLGRARALRTLTQSGLSDDLALAALESYAPEEDELERAVALARSLMRQGDTLERLAGRLGRRGFSANQAFKAARLVLPHNDEDTHDNDFV